MSTPGGLCPNCVSGGILDGEPTGTMESGAYFVRAETTADGPKKALVLLTDIFGLPLVNSKLIADKMSKKTGMDVWIPDIFDGKPPFAVDELEPFIAQEPGQTLPFWTKLKFVFALVPRLPALFANRAKMTDPRVHKVTLHSL